MLKRLFIIKEMMKFFRFLDHLFQPCFKDLSKDVIRQLSASLAGDPVASRHIYESFGIKLRLHRSLNIFELFPNTPVKLFKDVLEALQLYDLVELLEEPQKPQPVRSLRPGLPLQDIEKLRQSTDPRPTTYHSNVAVLIVTDEKNHDTEGIERFFKGFSCKSDVTVYEWKTQVQKEFQSQLMTRLTLSGLSRRSWVRLLNDPDFRRKQEPDQKELDANAAAVSAVIERWIHNQGW